MSSLILPTGVESPADPPSFELSPEFQSSVNMLMQGLELRSVVILRRKMDDSGDQVVFDIGVALPNTFTGRPELRIVGRLLPQYLPTTHELNPTSVQAPTVVD